MSEVARQTDLGVLRAQLLSELEKLEQNAHRCGMLITARGINRAKNAAGWEIAGKPLRAARSIEGAAQS